MEGDSCGNAVHGAIRIGEVAAIVVMRRVFAVAIFMGIMRVPVVVRVLRRTLIM